MAMDKAGLEARIIAYLTEKGYKPTQQTTALAYAIACAIIDEIQANAEAYGGVGEFTAKLGVR